MNHYLSSQPQFGQYYDQTPTVMFSENIESPLVTSDFVDYRNCNYDPKQNVSSDKYLPKTRKQHNPIQLPLPTPIQLGGNTEFGWNYEDNIRRDNCAITLDEKESQRPGYYQLSGFDPQAQHADNYANRMNEIMHFQKTYRNSHNYVDDESQLIYSDLSNLRQINQLFTRPYVGFYSGPGQPSLDNKDLESALQQGLLTNMRQKPCQVTRGTTFYRYQCLPEFGNPQREQHIIPPPVELGGWIRGGDATRDYVRRVDFSRRFQNKINDNLVNKFPN